LYQGFYRFSRDPFAAPADAHHMFMAAGHRDALSGVILDVLKRRPFVAVGGNGEVGKTTVLNAALASLTDQRRRRPVHVTRLDQLHLTSQSARQLVAQLLGKRTGELIDHDLQRLFHTLADCGKDGSQHVLVIDDAPSVTPGALEFLRLVAGLQTLDRTSLQVVLAGRNEFWETLTGDGGWATPDQVANRAAVEPLADNEVRRYIDYRLQLADSSVERVVTDAALGDIIRHGQALPGRINRILDRAFTVGAAQGFSRVTPRVVDEAVMFLEASNLLPPAPAAPAGQPAAAPIILNASHAVRDTADDPDAAARPGREAATRIVRLPAFGRSTWLAGAAAAAVFGIALSAGMLLPRVLPHFAAPSVASVDAVTPTAGPTTAGELARDAGIPVSPAASPERAAIDTAARTDNDHPAPGEAPAETLSQLGPTVTVRPAAAALPEPAPSGPPAEAVDPPTLSEPLAPSVQTAMAPSPTRPEASPAARPAAPDPDLSPDAQDRTQQRLEAGRLEPLPPQTAPSAADPAAMPPTPSAPPAASSLPPAVLAVLLDRGAAMLVAGDISAARLLYKRAADAGSAQAAVEIGKTYEPTFLANRRAIGIQADPTVAAGWYRRALSLGDTKAASLAQPGVVIAR
jgi:type II secretory pathway predicted ATPase ExeA